MDETNPPDSPGAYEPSIHIMPPSGSKTGCLMAIIVVLVIAVLAGGAVYHFGLETVKNKLAGVLKTGGSHSATPVPTATATTIPVPTAPPETPALILARQLIAADAASRKMIAVQLGNAPGLLGSAIQFLSDSLATASPEVKPDIVVSLGLLAKKDPEAIPPLITALDDKSLRREAIPSLGALGPAANAAIPKLKQIAHNKKESKSTRAAAQKALNQIQGKKTAAHPIRSKKKPKRR
jgi:hypothetical protein